MANRNLEIEGYGKITYTPINVIEKEYENVDLNGKPVIWVPGKMEYSGYFTNEEGAKIPKTHVRKKMEVDGEEILIEKFTPTASVSKEDVEILDDNQVIYTGIQRKMYKAFTDHETIKKLVIDENKTLYLGGIAFGNGYKLYNGYLTNWQGQLALFGIRGDMNKRFEEYKDDTVSLEVIPQNLDTKKILKAMAV